MNFALDRRMLSRAVTNGAARREAHRPVPASDLPRLPERGHLSARALGLRRAKALARGSTRGGKADALRARHPTPLALAQLVKRQLAGIGLDVS